jgi:hypothetical protein
MIRLLAIILFALSFIFYVWSVRHGVWNWTPLMLGGLFSWCVSDSWDHPLRK